MSTDWPELDWDRADKVWRGQFLLPTWGTEDEKDYRIDLTVHTFKKNKWRPTKKQAARYHEIVQNEDAFFNSLLKGLRRYFRSGLHRPDYAEDEIPKRLETIDDLKPFVPTIEAIICVAAKNGDARLVVSMEATWEPEHGMGFVFDDSDGFHVIKVGFEDILFEYPHEYDW